jgi:hypothetical protein
MPAQEDLLSPAPKPAEVNLKNASGNVKSSHNPGTTGHDDISTTKSDGAYQSKDQFDPNFTANVIAAMGPKTSPRVRQVMTSLIKHLHDFAREIELTVPEWSAGVDFVSLTLHFLPQQAL